VQELNRRNSPLFRGFNARTQQRNSPKRPSVDGHYLSQADNTFNVYSHPSTRGPSRSPLMAGHRPATPGEHVSTRRGTGDPPDGSDSAGVAAAPRLGLTFPQSMLSFPQGIEGL
jgi:hypothetical protein